MNFKVNKTNTAPIRLYVDDIRNPVFSGLRDWVVAKTSAEAIEILKTQNVIECSLDHDLGGDDTGYIVACWMEENNVWPKDGTFCHSANPIGRHRITAVINAAKRRSI